MKKKTLVSLITVLLVLLAAELLFVLLVDPPEQPEPPLLQTQPAEPSETTEETTEATQPEQTTGETTEETTEEPSVTTEPETEPEDNTYTLTLVGDCTLGSDPAAFTNPNSFISVIGTDYAHPFANVAEYFQNDDFTIINLESVLADSGAPANKTFTFRGPTAYSQILTLGSVEAVTLANNHSEDFGAEGYNTTKLTLSSAGVAYAENNCSMIYTTESGLTIGVYAVAFQRNDKDMEAELKILRDQGAEVIIAAVHWGTEGSYRITDAQKSWAHKLIDAGVDIVYGHHPHVLQPMEAYGDGIIFYSLGNFSFGGNTAPRDMDTAVVQVEFLRNEDGSVSRGETVIIPCRLSSLSNKQNNYQPTPYKAGTEEYDRTMSKLEGTFTGPDLTVNYEKPTDPTEPEETEPEETQPSETTPEETPPTESTPAESTPPETAPPETNPPETVPPVQDPNPGGET